MYSDLKNSLSQETPISKRTEPDFLKPHPNVTKNSSIAIELNSSCGTFKSIAIELKIDGQCALTLFFWLYLCVFHPKWKSSVQDFLCYKLFSINKENFRFFDTISFWGKTWFSEILIFLKIVCQIILAPLTFWYLVILPTCWAYRNNTANISFFPTD